MWLESVDTLRSDRSAERRAGANPAMATNLVRLIDYQLARIDHNFSVASED